MKLHSFFTILTALVVAWAPLPACTGIQLTQKDGSKVHGRTLEFGTPIVLHGAVIPRKFKFTGTTPKGNGLAYQSKYAVVGMYSFDHVAIMDGLNEKGLAAGAFYFPGFASYTPITAENQSKAVSSTEFVNWILTQFASLDEVKAALANVIIAPTIVEGWGPTPPPMHYIVYDAKGNTLVIEPIDGKLSVVESSLGTMTNSPNYDWHLTNLRNYINLSVNNVAPRQFDGMTLAPFGQGSGMVGLPGDFTPPSRFVRAAIFSQASFPAATSEEGIFQVFHILNQFDIPDGVARDKIDGNVYSDSTLATVARDPKTLKYYFRTYVDQTIRVIQLKEFNLDSAEVFEALIDTKQTAVDFSDELQ